MRKYIIIILSIALLIISGCTGKKNAPTEPFSAITNVRGSQYPMINPDGSVTFRVKAPDGS